MGKHEVQLVGRFEHYLQGEVQGVQTLLTGTSPTGQVSAQSLPSRFLVLHAVQFEAKTEQVEQSPLHATAIPEILT